MSPFIVSKSRIGLQARIINPSNTSEYDTCLRLRHTYFVSARGWVSCNGTMKEADHYDPYCHHLAVFHDDDILAYMRLLPWHKETNGFMLENEFHMLLRPQDKHSLVRHNSAELSRLVIAPHAHTHNPYPCDEGHTLLSQKNQPTGGAPNHSNDTCETPSWSFTPHVLELLFKLMYQVSLQQGITSYYAVAESSLLTILRRRFCLPFQTIGHPHIFPDGTNTRAAFAYVSDIEQALGDKHPAKLEWYRTLS